MRYIAGYLLLTLGGNESPAVADLEKLFGTVGVNFDQAQAETLVNELSGKDISEVLAAGAEKLASVPSGGAAVAAAPAAAGEAAAPAAEEKKEEPKEESDEDMGFGLFD